MDLFKCEVGKYFVAEREDQRKRVMSWLKITESARSVFSTVDEFDQGYHDMCEYVKSQIFSAEECSLAFDRQSVVLHDSINKRRRAIRQRFLNAKKKILRLRGKLFVDVVDTHCSSKEPADDFNSEDEFLYAEFQTSDSLTDKPGQEPIAELGKSVS
jgi:hypothetical protein